MSVSYTHLDVYKRQLQDLRRMDVRGYTDRGDWRRSVLETKALGCSTKEERNKQNNNKR